MAATSSKTVVYAAAAGNLLVALTKFIAAYITGSSAMLTIVEVRCHVAPLK